MTTKRRAIVAVAAFTLLICGALALWYGEPPALPLNPIASYSFDVSHKNARVDVRFQVPQYRSWVVAIWFKVVDHQDMDRVEDLFRGNQSNGLHPIVLPIHITIQELESDTSRTKLIFDSDVVNSTPYGAWPGHFGRKIVTIGLQPGLFRITAEALINNPELMGTPADLTVDYLTTVSFAADAIHANGEP
jgi:hypothetical protein